MKVLLATSKPFAVEAVEAIQNIIETAGHQLVKLEGYDDRSQLLEAVKGMDAIIVRSDIVDRSVIEAASDVKLIVRAGAGYDNVDLEAASLANVGVMNTPGQNANAVAELVFGMMLYLQRNHFDGSVGRELGPPTGVIRLWACGKRGGAYSKRIRDAGVRVLAHTYARRPEKRGRIWSDHGLQQHGAIPELRFRVVAYATAR